MPTTIQLREATLERLKEAKAETGASSYDEVISDLLRRAARGKTRFGAHSRMTPFAHGRTGHGD